jgi:L-ascorbate metabolism protein UlaG (beta-lactamase superfamily)
MVSIGTIRGWYRRDVTTRWTILRRVTAPGSARVTFLGHATVLIEMNGVRVLTDPILRNRVGPLVRSQSPAPESLWSGVDLVLISHSHWDHLDVGSLRLIDGAHVVVPRGMAAQLGRRGIRDVSEVVPGDVLDRPGVRIETVTAKHRGFGPPVGGTDLAVGFVVAGPQRVYFAGDTAWFAEMARMVRPVDVALLPVWGWGPTARGSEHLDPQGAARAAAAIAPRYAVPIHWGTLHPAGFRWMRPSTRIDPPHLFAQLVRRLAPATTVRVLTVGTSLVVAPQGPASGLAEGTMADAGRSRADAPDQT